MSGMAVYRIGDGQTEVRFWICDADEENMTPEEVEASEVICRGYGDERYLGKAGYSIDPFKAAEEILAEHYGHAEMVEAHYEWRPFARY